jgi:hypothetical protein
MRYAQGFFPVSGEFERSAEVSAEGELQTIEMRDRDSFFTPLLGKDWEVFQNKDACHDANRIAILARAGLRRASSSYEPR